jgi:hypothetical protein
LALLKIRSFSLSPSGNKLAVFEWFYLFLRDTVGDEAVLGHSGAVAGYEACAYFNPSSHRGILYLRNALGPGFSKNTVVAAIKLLSQVKP